ncbi:MAG: ThiF family adenylyltransferase [Candidatus Nanoarchaeia archaeon]|jgi:molybdopterin/thiamine biosynthesis adenylyltransferase|nr:ThiF family adenylyltransferase [Candidatus Nanoarchaeia archaeon]
MNTLKHEELYRSSELVKKMSNAEITVCGVGAIGSNLIDNLIRQGFEKITAIDMDRIEGHNRHTQIWTTRDTGQLKTNTIKNHVFNCMGFSIETISKKLEESNVKKLLQQNNIIIDGFDNVISRKLVTQYCREKSINCLHIGLAKDYAEIIWNDKYRIPDEVNSIDVCEYPLARNIILLAVAVATEILITYLDKKEKNNFIITLKDFKILKI